MVLLLLLSLNVLIALPSRSHADRILVATLPNSSSQQDVSPSISTTRRHLPSAIESMIECSEPEDPNAYFKSTREYDRTLPCWYLIAAGPSLIDDECSADNSMPWEITSADLACPWSCGKCPLVDTSGVDVVEEGDDDWDEHHGHDDYIWEEEDDDDNEIKTIGEVDGGGTRTPGNTDIEAANRVPQENDGAQMLEEEEPAITSIPQNDVASDETLSTGARPKQTITLDTLNPGGNKAATTSCNRVDGCGDGAAAQSAIATSNGFGLLPRKSRRWDAIIDQQNVVVRDHTQGRDDDGIIMERDAFYFTEMPSAKPSSSPSYRPSTLPSISPSMAPSSSPSVSHSDMPSSSPTWLPSTMPSFLPSDAPTVQHSDMPSTTPSTSPTMVPSSSPSVSPTGYPTSTPTSSPTGWISEPEPKGYPSSYFNYNPYSQRGVNNWSRIQKAREGEYWKADFDRYIAQDLNKNMCDSGSRRQSPIDVSFAESRGQCFEYHMIRGKPGEYSVEDPIVEKQILPSKLRLVYPRGYKDAKITNDADWVTRNDAIKGPSADVPKGWGHQLPVTHVDVKAPSEHTMEGKRYAAEYQIYLIQNREDKQRGAPAISVLIDLHPEDRRNWRFQIMLNAFEEVYDADMAKCENRMRKQRRLEAFLGLFGMTSHNGTPTSLEDQSTWLDEPEEEEEKFQRFLRAAERKAQQYRKFNPFSSEIVRSLWFFGYEGSLTEPPCSEFVEWRIIDTPALISKKQLFKLKKLLFHHVDENCHRTSVHFDGSVARPIQPYAGRLVHRCMCRDFIGDRERAEYGLNRCEWKERGNYGFDRKQYNKEWYARTHKYTEPKEQPLTDWASF